MAESQATGANPKAEPKRLEVLRRAYEVLSDPNSASTEEIWDEVVREVRAAIALESVSRSPVESDLLHALRIIAGDHYESANYARTVARGAIARAVTS